MRQVRPVMQDQIRFCIEPPEGWRIDDEDAYEMDICNGDFDVAQFNWGAPFIEYHLVTFWVGEGTIAEIESFCDEVLKEHLVEVSDEC